MRLLLLALSLFCLPSLARALGPDPHKDWLSADTEHFRITYAAPHRKQAEQAARIAENVYRRLSEQLQWQPLGRIELILSDEFDIANGYSTPIPFNQNALFLSPPDEGELLDNSVWLELLITHELTHTFHLDKVDGMLKWLRYGFGRYPLLFPNLLQPTWSIEGLATYNESTPGTGRGRLFGPTFEALMHIEYVNGFKSLSELNADGRALPTSKQYLYGVYFYDFLIQRYGEDAVKKYILHYSNNLVIPRLYGSIFDATGKDMDELWQEFIVFMRIQMGRRIKPMMAQARDDGRIILPAHYRVYSLLGSPDGTLAVVNDGWLRTRLILLDDQGIEKHLSNVKSGARIDRRADGKILLAQPEVCESHSLYYDLYLRKDDGSIEQKTVCGRYRRAVWLNDHEIAALQIAGGITQLVILDTAGKQWQRVRTLYTTPEQVEAVDLAARADGQKVALSIKHGADWQVLELDSGNGAAQVLFDRDAPIHSLHYASDNSVLELITVQDNVPNLFRFVFASKRLQRLSHTYTAVTQQGGLSSEGKVALAVIARNGTEIRLMNARAGQDVSMASTRASQPLAAGSLSPDHGLGDSRSYAPWYSIYPRSWFPVGYADQGLSAWGIFTFGSDALGWHNYSAIAMYENAQKEILGSLDYNYLGHHYFHLERNLQTRQWTVTGNNTATATLYDRTTDVQWASLFPLEEETDLTIDVGLGAAMQTTDRVQVAGVTTYPHKERLAATFLRYDSRDSNWYADGYNRGNLSELLLESYRPFKSYYDGHVVRFDTRSFFPLGKKVFSARWSESHAYGLTEPYQLGGVQPYELTQLPHLNQRNLPLRGYLRGEPVLRGKNSRLLNIEWRTPLADIDRHPISPPAGINRLSLALFLDAGGTWDNGNGPAQYYRGAGVELLAETKLFYRLALPLRIGIARGLDAPGGNHAYLMLGLSL